MVQSRAGSGPRFGLRRPIGPNRYFVRSKDEVLWPEPQPLSVLERLRLEMGNAAFSAQYQQDPTPPGGNRIRWEWFGTHDLVDPTRADFHYVVQSWDTGFGSEPTLCIPGRNCISGCMDGSSRGRNVMSLSVVLQCL